MVGVYCRPGIFRALLFFAIFAISTPFAKNTRSRNIQFRRSSNYFQNRVLTGTSACTSTGNRSIHHPHKFSLILSTTSIVWSVSCQFHRAHSRKIHARENFGRPFAKNNSARNISGLQYWILSHTPQRCPITLLLNNALMYHSLHKIMIFSTAWIN